MPLFQQTVVTKYLNTQDTVTLQSRWQIFQEHFHNPAIQENIRNSKEEQYQGEFLIDLFVNVLGYTKNPTPDFNLTTEYKNVKDSKKADGAIIFNEEVKAVIELKGTETTDLGKVETQAFGYKNNQPKCKYVITSNFEKLRFYIDNATEHLEFNLFTLEEKDFQLLYLCLAQENIEKDIPQKIKNASLSKEGEITKQLYKDYSLFKRELHQNLVALNPQFDALTLFKKSQKLLDRFLFLFFAEDRALLPPNSVRLVLSDWKELIERDEQVHLIDRFKKYFGYLNTGFKGKRYDVYPYNGGLFKPDEVLDHILIDDALLYNHTLKLSEYNFESEVDVNILGHIFENSLTEIEEVEAELTGQQTEKTKSKRKKDGVFYTPKYITKYIVENTVGKLCEQKKAEFDITDENYQPAKQRSRKRIENLQAYREWLLGITICDPACGSGAFLNQALEFLIAEHRYIDELSAKYNHDAFVLSEVENSILENNLFGVDINEESVEIAKLSLWLRTAQKNRKLNDLSHNIKCGNSLIDDPEFAGDKAFKWEEEFKTVFDDGGFDVVIGNPPYVKEATHKYAFDGLHHHPCYQGKMDLWYIFGWKALEIIKPKKGIIGFIAPNNWITNDGASQFRSKVNKDAEILKFIDFGDFKVFEAAGIQTMIYIMVKRSENNTYSLAYSKILDKKIDTENVQGFLNKGLSEKYIHFDVEMNRDILKESIFTFSDKSKSLLLKKMDEKGNFHLETKEIFSGIDIGQDFINKKSKQLIGDDVEVGDGVFNLSEAEFQNINFSQDERKLIKPFYTTNEINRYLNLSQNKYWVIYTPSKFKNPEEIAPYPSIKKHLDKFTKIITSDNKPYGLHRTRNENIFKGEKILSIRKCTRPSFSYVNFDSYVNRTFNIIKSERINLKYLTALLNSKLVAFWLKEKGKMQGDIFQVDMNPLISVPLAMPENDIQKSFIEKIDILQSLNTELFQHRETLLRSVLRNFHLDTLPKKLENWHELTFANFVNELKKKKVVLSLPQQAEWEDYFLKEQQKANAIKTEINKLDAEIDALVYNLYGLTAEEIKIVEGS